MQIKNYDINNLKHYEMFYMLDYITDSSVKLFRRTPAGDEEFSAYDLIQMPDGKLLIAFYKYWSISTIHNYVAISGNQEEFVGSQPFERIMAYWNLGIASPTGEKGVFCFFDSQPIHNPKDEWRCDTTFYGPLKYLGVGEEHSKIIAELAQIKTYETIISINGIANIAYLHRNDDEDIRDLVVNAEEVPAYTVTLSEMFRLISEWAALTDEPFNSTQDIALDAKAFLNTIRFDSSLVADQVDMQVAEYLKGNNNARQRPAGVVDNSPELLNFIKRKIAHMSLASLLSCYPEYEDIDSVIERDIESVNEEFNRWMDNLQAQQFENIDMIENALDSMSSREDIKQIEFILRLLKRKRDLALSFRK